MRCILNKIHTRTNYKNNFSNPMKNKFTRIGVAVAVAALPILANAQAIGTSTAETAVTGVIADLAVVFLAVITALLSVWAGLVGFRWGLSKFQRYVSGRKF